MESTIKNQKEITGFILLLILISSFHQQFPLGNSDSLYTKVAAAKGIEFEYYYTFKQSMKNSYGELKKLRSGDRINSERIKVINVNEFKKFSSQTELDDLIGKNQMEIISLRNYLKNSADEKNIQAIKRIFTMHNVEVDEIIGVHVNRNGGVDFFYYNQKQ